jgi:glycolate oxidase iron-sulfur subunit
MPAFDAHRPPELDVIETCVHCGFCLPTCPTYTPLWNEEMDSPRGRIVLMQEGLEGADVLSDEMVKHFDRCLGCLACVTACPSGVRYDRLIERTRAQVERHHRRSAGEWLFRRLVFGLFPHPRRLRALAPLVVLERRLGPGRLLPARTRLGSMARLARGIPPGRARRLPEELLAAGEPRGRVGLLQGCVQRVFFSQVNEASARVLAAEGYDVTTPERPRCCGALHLHTGYEEAGRRLAKQTIEQFEGCDHVAVNAAGCGSAMKGYGHLLEDEPDWAERALAFAAKVRDVSELLAGEPRAPRHALPLRVAYHDACHLAHAQALRAEPRALLGTIPGLELVEPAEWEICCGSAGVYNLLQPDAASKLGKRKAANLLATGAEAIAGGNPGCTLQIASHLNAVGRPLPIYHPVELVRMSIEGGNGAAGS